MVVLLCAALGSLALVPSAAQGRKSSTLHFSVLRASASATLIFKRTNGSPSSTDNGKASLLLNSKGKRGAGTLGFSTGRLLIPVKGHLAERVRLKRPGSISPYIVTTCLQNSALSARGGVTLTRFGQRVLVRWAFPQVRLRFCPGPKVSKAMTARMTRYYPARIFQQRRTTVVLKGSAGVTTSKLQASYRWTGTLLIQRAR